MNSWYRNIVMLHLKNGLKGLLMYFRDVSHFRTFQDYKMNISEPEMFSVTVLMMSMTGNGEVIT